MRHLSGAPGASNLTVPLYRSFHLGGGAAGENCSVPEDDVTVFLSFYHSLMELLVVYGLYFLLALMQTQDQLSPYAIGAAGSC